MSEPHRPAAPAAHPRFKALFQSFDDLADGTRGAARLAALRAELARLGLDGYVIPRADPHQNEYVPECEERLAFLTGFTGSAGLLVVLAEAAALFVDGRYTLQAPAQVDTGAFEVVPLAQTSPEKWIETHLPKGASLGFDAWRTTLDGRDKLAAAVAAAGGILVAVETDPLAPVWTDRPPPPHGAVRMLDLAIAGEETGAKLRRVRETLGAAKVDGLLVSDPHAAAWLFNIRGADVAHTPLPLAWSIVPAEGVPLLFLERTKLPGAVRDALEAVAHLHPVSHLDDGLAAFSRGRRMRIDQATCPVRLAGLIEKAGGTVDKGADPIALLKASKNPAEIAGMRAAHLRDGVALARFLAWFRDRAAAGGLTEIDAVEALETFRRECGELTDVSFPTIAGAGPNGAIVHYRVTRSTNREIRPGELFLLDSGAQYPDGTTDITRTLAVGAPTPQMRAHYTLVLKGHLAIARAVFPKGVAGAQLDPFARQYLWAAGLDFDHGTGHGVGAGLSVHEGPARISKLGHVPLAEGMILSNEPGYYREGDYGIRIENLVLVEPREVEGAEKPCLGFSTLTLVPYERALINLALIDPAERAQIDAYHLQVREALTPFLEGAARDYVVSACQVL
ncbi:aminopeptidase P family protein [Xanthobacter tagetidis]|uniref:Aminopeptidase P family protein n=1 Tax=Xanthobacter tagetidis TaxID=60216 RepID=A0A3L7AA97_9HYPH|nr:aminopeptidase P family protein [Xanthobacter tagetidis]MBB6308379.1 Xaa-Pro aminopeptidase [Xanthobacter tagetidis]RLP76242.1 aminopeptidase P family protein [Xanthobacter tagetidis]